METSIVTVIARIAMSLVFIVSGAQKLLSPARMAPLFEVIGLPSQTGIAIGLFEVAGGSAVALGFQLRWAAWALAFWLLITAAIGHQFWKDPKQLSDFLKNVGLAGAFLAFGFWAKVPPTNLSN